MVLVVNATFRPLYPKERPGTHRKLDRTEYRSRQVRKISPPPGFHPRTVHPVDSRYTNWAIQAQIVAWLDILIHSLLSLYGLLFTFSLKFPHLLQSLSVAAYLFFLVITNKLVLCNSTVWQRRIFFPSTCYKLMLFFLQNLISCPTKWWQRRVWQKQDVWSGFDRNFG